MDDAWVWTVIVATALASGASAWLVLHAAGPGWQRWRDRATAQARLGLREAFLALDPRRLFALQVAVMAGVAAIGGWVSGSAVLALALLAVAAVLPRIGWAWLRRRRRARLDAQLPDALQLMAGALRAGLAPGAALARIASQSPAPLAQELALLLHEQRLGVASDQALDRFARRVPTPSVALVVSALRIAAETGGPLAETLERTADTLRRRRELQGRIDALTAQGRLQAWVVGALPPVLVLVLARMEPGAMSLLWTTPTGWGVLALVAGLEVAGVWLIRRIVAIDV